MSAENGEADMERGNIQNHGQWTTEDEIGQFRNFLEERERKRVTRRVRQYRSFRERNYELVTDEEVDIYFKDQVRRGERRIAKIVKLWTKYLLGK